VPDFIYTAVTKDGRRETATIQAPNLAAAGHLLKEQGLLPTELQEKDKTTFLDRLSNLSTIPLAEKITFIENLGIMMKAGISVTRSIQILTKQTKNAKFKNISADIYKQVEQGKTLGEAMARHPDAFSNIVVSMVKVGELSGNLEKSLEYLSIQLQREADLRSKTKGAMIYPSVIVAALVIVGVLMSIFVLPKLTSVFKDFQGELPASTKIVMAMADFMSAHGVVVIVGMILFIIGFIMFMRSKPGQRALDITLVNFYLINTIVKKINLARFARILSSLLHSGIPIVQGLEVAADSMGNVLYQELVREASASVKLGKPLTEALSKNEKLFPVLVVQMLQVGEESGTVEDILSQLAVHYEAEVDDLLKNLSSIIEPLLLLFIGGVVGVLAVALIAPIYSIGQNIQ